MLQTSVSDAIKTKNNVHSEHLSSEMFTVNNFMSKTLGEKIKEARKSRGLTLKELGKMIGYSHSLLSRIEGDKHFPEDATLLALGKEFNNDFGIEWLKESLSYKPKLSTIELAELVNDWIEYNQVFLDSFLVILAMKNNLFRQMIDKHKLEIAQEKVKTLNEIFDIWDDEYEEKRKTMYEQLNARPELVEQLLQNQKGLNDAQEIAPKSQSKIRLVTEKKSQKKAG